MQIVPNSVVSARRFTQHKTAVDQQLKSETLVFKISLFYRIFYYVDKKRKKNPLKKHLDRKNIILCSYLIQRCVTIFHSCTVIFKNVIICLKPSGQKSRYTIPIIQNNSTLLFHFPICTLEEHLQPMVVWIERPSRVQQTGLLSWRIYLINFCTRNIYPLRLTQQCTVLLLHVMYTMDAREPG